MPAQEQAFLFQRALLWAFTGYDGYGQPTVSTIPVEIPCRWNTVRREVLDHQGNTIALDAQVWVAQKIHIGSHIWLGTYDQWVGTGSGSGLTDEELCEVKTYNATEDIRGQRVAPPYQQLFHTRQVGVIRLHNKGAD